ncbi:MAG TPA: enoyl-CoA hydratase-related protein [Burkholderiaceae bacterium]|nr:enoyl-CoA hydratase-related protein [Burkholderiaceae bacterium]
MDPATPELRIDGKIATITLRRPAQANRLELVDLSTLREQLETVNATLDVLVLRLCAMGKTFCSGFNIGKLDEAATAGAQFEALTDALENARPVTVAAINGGIYGGATDLALACDFRIGVRTAEMFVPAAKLGLHFYRGGLERYVSRLGLATAKRVLLAAEKFDAPAMLACGFLDRLVESAADLDEVVDGFSAQLASMAPLALLGMKKHLNRIARNALDADDIARDIARADASADLAEGVRAWQDKRAPLFVGR